MAAVRKGWRRHLEGWELGVIVVVSATVAALVAVPRAVIPAEPPLPRIDRVEQRAFTEREAARARAAERQGLPVATRAVGEALRTFGAANARGATAAMKSAQADLLRTVNVARQRGSTDELLRLRAIQTELFIAAVQNYVATGQPSDDLHELGGNFASKAASLGWLEGRVSSASRSDLETLFRVRWARLLGLDEIHPFAPSVNEWRVYYAFQLRQHPKAERASLAEQLASVDAISRLDPSYPAALARGILYYHQGNLPIARAELQRFVASESSGRWQLRARNYLNHLIQLAP